MDLRHGLRQLRAHPGFTMSAVLTLGLAIGANTAIFGALRGLLLRRLPWPDAGRLAFVQLTSPRLNGTRVDTLTSWSYPKYEELRRQQAAFSELAGFGMLAQNLTSGEEAERVNVELATGSYFPLLGVRTVLGRTFTPAESAMPGGNAVVVISHSLWQRRFGGADSVLGRTLELNHTPFSIVGVAAPGFSGLSQGADVWVPLTMATALYYPEALQERGNHWFRVIARLRPDVDWKRAVESTARAGQAIARSSDAANPAGSAVLVRLDAQRVSPLVRRTTVVLFSAVLLVLLVACANIATLLHARNLVRRRELAVRLALGAGPGRILRQLAVETLLLALLGGALGLLLAAGGVQVLSAFSRAVLQSDRGYLVGADAIGMDGGVITFGLGLTLLTALAAGVTLLRRAARPMLSDALSENAAGSGVSRSGVTSRISLVVTQAAFAALLVVSAVLLLRSLGRLASVDTGFDATHVLTLRVAPSRNDSMPAPALYRDLTARLAALPGVSAASVDACTPLSGLCSSTVATRAGAQQFAENSRPEVGIHFVMPAHLSVLGIPLRRGRMFTPADNAEGPRVVVLSETAARVLFGNEDPIGQPLQLATAFLRDGATAEVIGIVGNVHYDGIEQAPGVVVYAPALQFVYRSMYVFLRTTGEPLAWVAAVRDATAEVAPAVPLFDVRTMEDRARDVLARARLLALLLTVFAGLALTLASVGQFGVMSYIVGQRGRELGIRLALGAEPLALAARITRQGMGWVAAGTAMGLVLALLLTRQLADLLYQVSPRDPLTFAGVAVLLLVVGACASLLPARRAARTSPLETMRVS